MCPLPYALCSMRFAYWILAPEFLLLATKTGNNDLLWIERANLVA
jgi:hypothetical protein